MSIKNWIHFSLLALIWGTSFLWIKIVVGEVSPIMLVSFRTLFATLGLAMVLLFDHSARLRWKILRPRLGVFVMVGFLNVALPFVLISWSETYIESGMASILNSTVPLFTIVLAPLFLSDDRFSLPKLLGLLVGFAGVIVLFLPALSHGVSHSLIGQGGMLLATLSYAAGGVYARVKTRGLPPQIQAFMQFVMATLLVWALMLLVDRPLRFPHLAITWVGLLWLGLLGSCIAYLLYFSLLNSVGPTRTLLVTYMTPLVGVLLGAAYLHEQVTWQAVVGGILIVSGVVVVNFKFQPSKLVASTEEC
jgi:drug/metabolite transporter (DMT)-like permease